MKCECQLVLGIGKEVGIAGEEDEQVEMMMNI
jgi:hypothetical protein